MAHAEAIKRFYDDKNFAVATYSKYDPQPEADVARLYDIYARESTLDRVPLLAKAALAASAQRLSGDIPTAKTFDYQTCVDMGPVRKLIADGFFEKLFGPAVKVEQDTKLAQSFA